MDMAPLQSLLFKPTTPHQPIAILMLIENSLAMSQIWPDLRDQYVTRVVETATSANVATTPITVSVLESYPCQDHGANPSLPRQYSGNHDALGDLKFNHNPDNKISIGRINSCVDFLDSFKYQGQPAALHLIIVAATPPSDDSNEACVSPGEYSPWIFLAKKMAERSIHCHIVVSPQNATGSLTTLFEETLRMQANIEEQLYPPVDPSKVILRLSAKPNHQIQQAYSDSASSNLYSPPERLHANLPRRSSYPADNSYSDAFATPAPTDGEAPSLVSQLQQVHGLTKKKVYGAKPVRQPFFREERIQNKYAKAPSLLTMPPPVVDQAPSPTAGGKVLSHSRADRIARVGQSSPTETHSRQYGVVLISFDIPRYLAWKHICFFHVLGYFLAGNSRDLYGRYLPWTSKSIPSTASTTAIHGMAHSMNVYQTGGMPEPSWSQQQSQPPYGDGYGAVSQSYFPPMLPPPQYFSNRGELVQQNDLQIPPPEQTVQLSVPSSLPDSSYTSYGTEQQSTIVRPQVSTLIPASSTNTSATSGPESTITVHGSTRHAAPKRRPSQEDEERFTFSQDFVAATAVLFEAEVLPAYPNYPGMSSGLSTRSGMQAALPRPPPERRRVSSTRRGFGAAIRPTNR
ncbi:hypothetical protein BJ912DRAFT_1046492 [Pholiota molesta]|nr:hypothetical protein BJ912DRAFT_1046492 [Pholiota molesta]